MLFSIYVISKLNLVDKFSLLSSHCSWECLLGFPHRHLKDTRESVPAWQPFLLKCLTQKEGWLSVKQVKYMSSHTCPYISLLNLLNPINLFLMCWSNSHFLVTVQVLLCFMAKCQNFFNLHHPQHHFCFNPYTTIGSIKRYSAGVVACTHNPSILAEHETERWWIPDQPVFCCSILTWNLM